MFPRAALDATDSILHLPAVEQRDCDEVLDRLIAVGDGFPQMSFVMSMKEARRAQTRLERDGGSGALTHAEALGLIVPIVESLFDDEVRELGLAFHAQLILMCAFPSIPESLAVQVAFGRKVGEEQFRKIARFSARAHHRGITVDEYVDELVDADAVPHDRPVRLFLGESRRTPSAERLRRAVTLLRCSAALAPEPFRPSLLCAIAWMQWAQGRRPIALSYLDEASRIEPANPLAHGLKVTFESRMPAWCAG